MKPLRGRDKLRPRPEPAGGAREPRSADPVAGEAPRFLVERTGSGIRARREDVSRRTLSDLAAGRTPVEREVDLHGLAAAEAERALVLALRGAQREGVRCVLVIHGAGLHSESGPVLKDALPAWLMEGGHAREILAFATAPRERGGPGATLVLQRRPR